MSGMVMCVFDGSTVRLLHHDDEEPVTLATFNVGHLSTDETIAAAFELYDWYRRQMGDTPVANGNGNGHKRARSPKQAMLELQAKTLSLLRMAEEPMTARQISEAVGVGADRKFSIYRLLKTFMIDGLVERIDGYPYRYRAVPADEARHG